MAPKRRFDGRGFGSTLDAMTAWRRANRWLMLALACLALGAASVPARAQAQADAAAQVELLARRAQRAEQARDVRPGPARLRPSPRARVHQDATPRRPALAQRPAPPGRLYLTHRALLR